MSISGTTMPTPKPLYMSDQLSECWVRSCWPGVSLPGACLSACPRFCPSVAERTRRAGVRPDVSVKPPAARFAWTTKATDSSMLPPPVAPIPYVVPS